MLAELIEKLENPLWRQAVLLLLEGYTGPRSPRDSTGAGRPCTFGAGPPEDLGGTPGRENIPRLIPQTAPGGNRKERGSLKADSST